MKKFFTFVPPKMDQLRLYSCPADGSPRLEAGMETCFPVMAAVSSCAVPGEDIRLAAVMPDTREGFLACCLLEVELSARCKVSGIICTRDVELIHAGPDSAASGSGCEDAAGKLAGMVENGDEIFLCVTYGRKPAADAAVRALRQACRSRTGASLSCILCGQVTCGEDGTETAGICDVTAQAADERDSIGGGPGA